MFWLRNKKIIFSYTLLSGGLSVLNTQIYYAMEMKTLFNRFNLQDYMPTSHRSKKSDVTDKRLILFFLIKHRKIPIEMELQSNLVNSKFFLQIKGILYIIVI